MVKRVLLLLTLCASPLGAQQPLSGRTYLPYTTGGATYGASISSGTSWAPDNYVIFISLPLGSTGIPATFYSYWGSPDSSKSWGAALYSNSSSTPAGATLLCSNLTSTAPTTGFNAQTLSGCPSMSATTYYYIGITSGSSTQLMGETFAYCPGTSNYGYYTSSPEGSTSFPATVGAVTEESATYGCHPAYLVTQIVTTGSNGKNYLVPGAATMGRTYLNTFNGYLNFEGSASATEITTSLLNAGTFGDGSIGTLTWSGTPNAAMTFASAAQGPALSPAAVVNNAIYAGSGSVGFECDTDGTGGSCSPFAVQVENPTPELAIWFWTYTTCPVTTEECGAGVRISINGSPSDYASIHFGGADSLCPSSNCAGLVHLETTNSTQNFSTQSMSYTANTWYRVGILAKQGPSAMEQMTVCGPNMNFLQTFTNAGAAGSSTLPAQIDVGIAGEEPATAGIFYYDDNFLIDRTGALFSTTGCY